VVKLLKIFIIVAVEKRPPAVVVRVHGQTEQERGGKSQSAFHSQSQLVPDRLVQEDRANDSAGPNHQRAGIHVEIYVLVADCLVLVGPCASQQF